MEDDMLQSALKRVDNLYQISHAIGVATTPNEVIAALLQQEEFQDANRVIVGVYADVSAEEWHVLIDYHSDGAASSEGNVFERTWPMTDTLVITNIAETPLLSPSLRGFLQGAESVVIFPLIAGQDNFGCLILQFADSIAETTDELFYLRGLVQQVAVSLRMQQLYQSEAEARRLAEEANKLKLRLLAVTSHELRTPLTSIKGFATTLMADDVEWNEEDRQDFLLTIEQEADKLSELISQLLDLSRIEAGTLSVNLERIHPAEIVDYAHASLQSVTQDYTLNIHMQPDLPFVKGDRSRLAQVLINLVSNATDHSPVGSIIDVRLDLVEPETVRVAVEDEGNGIPHGAQARIFEAFNRASEGRQGLGLGLTISKGIVERHNGEIAVAKTDEKGTIMTFTLPTYTSL